MGSKSSPPPTPDYTGAAQAQGASSLENTRLAASLNRPDVTTPLGSQTFTLDPNNPDKYNQNISLTPQGQGLLDTNLKTQQQMADVGNTQLGRASDALSKPIDFSGAPKVNPGGFMSAPGFDASGLPPTQTFNSPGTPGQVQLNTLPNSVQRGDNSAAVQQVQDALYGKQTQYLDPQFKLEEEQTRQRLADQGFQQGDAGYSNAQGTGAMDAFDRQKQLAYSNARDSAILAGGAEDSRLFGINSQTAQQAIERGSTANAENLQRGGLDLSGAGLQTQQAQQSVSDALAARSQLAGERGQAAQFGQAGAQLNTQQQQAQFGQQTAERNQAIQEALLARQTPLNEVNSLRTGSQVQMPQFQATPGVSPPDPTQYMAATNAAGQYNLGTYNSQVAQQNAMTSGLFGLGSAGIGAYGLAGSGLGGLGGLGAAAPILLA